MIRPLRYILIPAWLAAWAFVIFLFTIGVIVLMAEGLLGGYAMAGGLIGVSLLLAGLVWSLGNRLFPDMWRRRPG